MSDDRDTFEPLSAPVERVIAEMERDIARLAAKRAASEQPRRMRDDPRVLSYAISPDDAGWLLGAVALPADIRREVLAKLLAERGADAFVALFAEFIGLANSVVANNRVMVEELGFLSGALHPDRLDDAHAPNLPTIWGALNGVRLAARIPASAKPCGGCAFRLGTPANQSPSTTCDAEACADDGEDFMCHEDLDDAGAPKSRCVGYLLAVDKTLAREARATDATTEALARRADDLRRAGETKPDAAE